MVLPWDKCHGSETKLNLSCVHFVKHHHGPLEREDLQHYLALVQSSEMVPRKVA